MVKVGVVISVISYQLSVISYHSDLSNIVTVITVAVVADVECVVAFLASRIPDRETDLGLGIQLNLFLIKCGVHS